MQINKDALKPHFINTRYCLFKADIGRMPARCALNGFGRIGGYLCDDVDFPAVRLVSQFLTNSDKTPLILTLQVVCHSDGHLTIAKTPSTWCTSTNRLPLNLLLTSSSLIQSMVTTITALKSLLELHSLPSIVCT